MSSSVSRTSRRVAGQRRPGAPLPARPAPTSSAPTPSAPTRPTARPASQADQALESSTPAVEGVHAVDAVDAVDARPGTPTRRALAVPAAALVLALLAVGGLLGLTLRGTSDQERSTRAATSAAKLSLEQLLSYNYATFDTQSSAAQRLLTGRFRTEFATAMTSQVKPLAVKNQTVVQARVSEVGVMKQTADAVTVLAYVNQATVGADATTPTVDQNRVIATLTKVGERWLVSDVKAF